MLPPTVLHSLEQQPVATEVVTVLPTQTAVATAMSSHPTPIPDATYRLVVWTPERADQLIDRLQGYPDTLDFRGYHDDVYLAAYLHAATAQQEALFRFPTAVFADTWSWERAYHLAQAGAGEVGDVYGELVAAILNDGDVSLGDLPAWFAAQDPSLALSTHVLSSPMGYTNAYLIEIAASFSGIYLWLLESSSGFEVYPLKSGYDFGFAHAAGLAFRLEDVTGDGVPEAITVHIRQAGSSVDHQSGTFDVFDLSQVPPQKLPLAEPSPFFSYGANGEWSVVSEDGNDQILRFESYLDSYFCPDAVVVSDYVWNGEMFVLWQREYPDVASLDEAQRENCASPILQALLTDGRQGMLGAFDALNGFILAWPFVSELDGRDEVRFELGLLYALYDRTELARQQMMAITTEATVADGEWAGWAEQFVVAYKTADDLLAACAAFGNCHSFLDVPDLVEHLPSFSNVVEQLEGAGVPVLAATSFDLDGDNVPEDLLLVGSHNSEGSYGTLWIVSADGERLETKSLSSIRLPAETITVTVVTSEWEWPVLQVQTGENNLFLTIQSNTTTGISRIEYLSFVLRQEGRLLIDRLLSGDDAEEVVGELDALQQIYGSLYEDEIRSMGCISASFCYWLGVAYELGANEANAVEAYLNTWQHFSDTPYAIMARARLGVVP